MNCEGTTIQVFLHTADCKVRSKPVILTMVGFLLGLQTLILPNDSP